VGICCIFGTRNLVVLRKKFEIENINFPALWENEVIHKYDDFIYLIVLFNKPVIS